MGVELSIYSIEERLAIANKKNPSSIPSLLGLRASNTITFAQSTPPKRGVLRDVTVGVYFSVPKSTEFQLVKKKNPSRWNIRVFMGVYCFYSIVKSIDLIGTCLKILSYPTYVRFETGTLLLVPTTSPRSPCSYKRIISAAPWRWRPLARNGAIATAAPSLSADISSRGPR